MKKVSNTTEIAIDVNTVLVTGFQSINKLNLKRKKSKVIVTNNINARDANGQMSHIWIVSSVQKTSDNEFIAFTDGDRRISSITHFCELP